MPTDPPDGFEFFYRAAVVRVIDGDTIDAAVALGMGVSSAQRVRVYGPDPDDRTGLNAPELTTPPGPTAKAFLERLLLGKPGLPPPELVLRTVRDRHEKFGRLLAVPLVRQEDGSWLNVSQALLDAHQATPRAYSFPLNGPAEPAWPPASGSAAG